MKSNTVKAKIVEKVKRKQPSNPEKECILLLEKIVIFISHKLRQPVAHILGLSSLLTINDTRKSDEKNHYMNQSALLLDKRSRELSTLIEKKIVHLKKELSLNSRKS